MQIRRVTPTVINIPRADTLKTSYGSRSYAQTVLVEVETDEGLIGIGQTSVDAPFYGEPASGIIANINAHLGPAILGHSPLDIERLNRRMADALPGHLSTRAGVDLALWDLKGKALGVPVYQLLGGRFRDGISLMGFVRHDTPQAMYDAACATLAETPYPVLKMKVGPLPGCQRRCPWQSPHSDRRQHRLVAGPGDQRAERHGQTRHPWRHRTARSPPR